MMRKKNSNRRKLHVEITDSYKAGFLCFAYDCLHRFLGPRCKKMLENVRNVEERDEYDANCVLNSKFLSFLFF